MLKYSRRQLFDRGRDLHSEMDLLCSIVQNPIEDLPNDAECVFKEQYAEFCERLNVWRLDVLDMLRGQKRIPE